MQKNRALRATALILLTWIGGRSTFLLLSSNAENLAPIGQKLVTALPVAQGGGDNRGIAEPIIARPTVLAVRMDSPVPSLQDGIMENPQASGIMPPPVQSAPLIPPMPRTQPATAAVSAPVAAPEISQSSRFSGASLSAWAIVRPDSSGTILATNGQLGASQAGVRIQLPLFPSAGKAPVAFNLRASTPLDQKLGSEAGLGLSVRPVQDVPAELIIERRVALDRGGRNAFAVIAAGGIDDQPLTGKMTVSGYAQGGVVGLSRKDSFIDGALRVEQVIFNHKRTGLRFGAGLWGAAQPGVSRVDLGPIMAVKQSIGGASLRISAEYRWRVAGQAQPASGPALAIGADF